MAVSMRMFDTDLSFQPHLFVERQDMQMPLSALFFQ